MLSWLRIRGLNQRSETAKVESLASDVFKFSEFLFSLNFSVIGMFYHINIGEYDMFEFFLESDLKESELREKLEELMRECASILVEHTKSDKIIFVDDIARCAVKKLIRYGFARSVKFSSVYIIVPPLSTDLPSEKQELREFFGDELMERILQHNEKAWEERKKWMREWTQKYLKELREEHEKEAEEEVVF